MNETTFDEALKKTLAMYEAACVEEIEAHDRFTALVAPYNAATLRDVAELDETVYKTLMSAASAEVRTEATADVLAKVLREVFNHETDQKVLP